jgi:hypothetical protein
MHTGLNFHRMGNILLSLSINGFCFYFVEMEKKLHEFSFLETVNRRKMEKGINIVVIIPE